MPHASISIRLATLMSEKWLDRNGQWGDFTSRKRFSDKHGTAQDDAEAFVQQHLGSNFKQFGLFPNS